MTKPTMELVEKVMALVAEYGRDCHCNGEYDVPLDTPEAAALLSEIRQRLEAMEREAARYRWLKAHAHKIEWHAKDEDGSRICSRPTLDADIDRARGA